MKTGADLVDLYYASVGRGASWLRNVPPDRRGRIHENDILSLRALRRTLDATTTKLRLRITRAPVCPAISEVAVFLEPDSSP